MPADKTSPTKSVWCSLCGQKFSRKEHLERHIPTHTNVKPYLCTECFLDFNRRDLLTRHILTYHQAKAPGDLSAGGIQSVSGKTPIACQNCANAKTGCDKKVPCQRCKEKSLDCTPRFARRSTKIGARTAQAMGQATQVARPGPQPASQQHPLPSTEISSLTGLTQHMTQTPSPMPQFTQTPSPNMPFSNPVQTLDPRLHGTTLHMHESPLHSHLQHAGFQTSDTADFLLGQMHNTFQDVSHGYGQIQNPWDQEDGTFDFPSYGTHDGLPLSNYADLGESSPSTAPLSTPSLRTAHTRGTSIISNDLDSQHIHKPLELRFDNNASQSAILEFEDVVKAEAAWPLARCNKAMYSGTCPRTALTHLTFFQRSSKQQGTWLPLENYVRDHVNWEEGDLTSVIPLQPHTRDQMLAITQKFLHKALEIHGSSGGRDGYSGFVVLPPPDIIRYFLQSYVRSLSVYFPLVVSGCVDPNGMLNDCGPTTLLLLLMIAQGAAAMPVAEARYLSTGLTETCRISLFDIIEKNVELSADPVALRCALLFTLLGSWSGDKWLMDIAMGQRGMYMSMLKHAGMLEPQPCPALDLNVMSRDALEAQQQTWITNESRNRLVYNWVMLDFELSLFHDSVPLLAITELRCPLPAPEALWTAKNAADWATGMRSMYRSRTTPSLCDLFRGFLQNNLSGSEDSLTPQRLRLLLHPIHAMLCQARQLHSCLPEPRTAVHTVNKTSSQQRIQEIQCLLQQWYNLTLSYSQQDSQCALTRCNLVLYHLMHLNAVTNFPEIERLARREGFEDTLSFQHLETSLRHKCCIFERETAIFHCGQVLRFLRQMPRNRRPSWWTAAMYRAVLILWADSISHMDTDFKSDIGAMLSSQPNQYPPNLVPVDQAEPTNLALNACLSNGHGIPVLTRLNGSPVKLDNAAEILDYGIKAVDEGDSSRIGDGIRRKLIDLLRTWKTVN